MKSFAGQLASGSDKLGVDKPQLNLTKVSSEALKMGDLKDTSKRAKYSNMVFQLEDDQLELDESDINELDQNMQVYLRFQKSLTTRFNFKKKSITSSKTFHRMLDNSGTEDPQQADNSKMPTSSLFGRLQKGMANIKSKNKPPNSKKYNFSDAYEIHSSTARLDQQRAGRGNLLSYRTAQHHSKRVSLINPPRSGYRYREDAVLEADREDSFEEDEEFDSDADGGARKRKIGSLMQKEKDIFT